MTITTPITELFGIQHPVLLAGMNVAAGPRLAAAVSNAGGLGVIGGVGYTPKHLRGVIKEIKEGLNSPDLPFGVDLLLPQVGGSARKTNYDYTKGNLDALIDVIIEEKAKLFVCAVGVPPKHVVDKLHKHGILVMNMIGHPKHADKALAVGVDIICAQGGEGGGHTGSIPTSILIPAVVDRVKGKTSPLTGKPIYVVAAGGMADGRGLAAALMWGAQAVWVGTRFVASVEAGAPKKHKELILSADHGDTNTTLIYTGRPLRVRRTDYVKQWEGRQDEIKSLTSQGKLPHEVELSKKPELSLPGRPWKIIDEMVATAEVQIKRGQSFLTGAKL
ncbi:hypothetical protein CcaverHIS002_0101170 [Cutaneotrichosporon cavernicola]|uniref:2-nitropropane dioxygenase n=1 Tax=Cutaneotrichosporon cavernicola TaxID=279322 RepID=A0AA48L0D1_9TREE|nr:uncharacterized protein CcaverHIS019_0101150 [Cutaneotrichosporon cavernicola]BEI79588.1 hypothetical protein CcaverHIS002_0101170 [Cutaneotrichosporon cavernicola]BEI87397.1 hypothetical protein CcaverHIS019_0101150 [Cutaneotrichosporon cavernicola]BEI95165.1 hypothetical protein CcaverHIS631_0101140 [Cutaneotrichosporon cavernicola]BEJ02939.1 hypothetical protein CcaverHIS641_0101140 [Cutaneotrichosporon cavernicola]